MQDPLTGTMVKRLLEGVGGWGNCVEGNKGGKFGKTVITNNKI